MQYSDENKNFIFSNYNTKVHAKPIINQVEHLEVEEIREEITHVTPTFNCLYSFILYKKKYFLEHIFFCEK